MKKATRLVIVLSIFWVIVAFPSIYTYSIKSANESANVLLDYCKSMQSSYPNEADYMDRCKTDRDEIYDSEVSNINLETTVLTFVPLAFLIFVSFIIRKAIEWIKNGS
jgi:hypothetical protein